MYIPEIYKNENQEDINAFIDKNGFAILVNISNQKLWATHIPLVLGKNTREKEVLFGHVSLLNPQAKNLENGSEVLAIFSGANAYISSSWYDHENVPTYNYIAVHVYGKIMVLNYEQTVESLKKLVDKYEKKSLNPIKIEDLAPTTMQQVKGILAFEIEITSIEAVKKLSQNRDEKNYATIISELEKTNLPDAKAIANEMKNNRKK